MEGRGGERGGVDKRGGERGEGGWRGGWGGDKVDSKDGLKECIDRMHNKDS